jgi:ParB family transcriptional regulator, chromosome partitioning protein
MTTENSLAPDQVGIKNVPTNELKPNPHNPRLLFDRLPLETLKSSIQKVGILVPLTAYWDPKRSCYTILDGQRRWICARDLKLRTVPINQVAEPTLVQNIVTMFQIHKLRQDWELMPTALKLEVLMRAMNERTDRRLSELTGLDPAVVSRCKKLLSYPRKFQDMMLDVNPDKRIKADFFIELYVVVTDREVTKMDWFKRDRFTQQMLKKYAAGGIKSVTEFRKVKQLITSAVRSGHKKQISARLQKYADTPKLGWQTLEIAQAAADASAKKLLKSVTSIHESLHELDVEEYYGRDDLWDELERLRQTISSLLLKAGKRSK